MTFCRAIGWLIVLLGTVGVASSHEPDSRRELSGSMRLAISEWDPGRLPDIANALANWDDAVIAVEAYLAQPRNHDVADGWRTFLDWKPLRDAIAANASTGVLGSAALPLRQRLRGLNAGLELEPMLRLRAATDRLIAALRYSDPSRSERLLKGQLGAMAEALEVDLDNEASGSPSASTLDRMAVLTQTLLAANQAPGLVKQIQECYSEPNLRVSVSQAAVDALTTRPIDDRSPVRECILGSRMVGDSRLRAQVSTQLLPHDGHVRLLLRMDGRFDTRSRSYRKPVSVDTIADTNVYVARQVIVTEKRTHLGDVIARVNLQSQIQRVNHPLKLVRRIALNKAMETKPQAEAISSGRLKERLIEDFKRRSDSELNRTFPSIDEEVGPWLKRLGLAPVSRHLHSTTQQAQMVASLSAPDGLRSPRSAPAIADTHPDYEIAVQIHESAAAAMADPLLAGETISPESVRQIADQLGLNRLFAPESGESVDLGEFEVDFASTRPAFFEARDQTLRLGFKATRFSSDGRELKVAMQIVAVYRPVRRDGGLRLVRDPDLEITFPRTRRLSTLQAAQKANMVQVMSEVFPSELLKRGLEVPADASTRLIAGRTFQVDGIDLQHGWATITLRITD
ncbi:MAG: hypothetical protein AAGD07_21875 [Planctomycetota bacterium]